MPTTCLRAVLLSLLVCAAPGCGNGGGDDNDNSATNNNSGGGGGSNDNSSGGGVTDGASLSGRVLDTNAFVDGQEVPVIGARVSLLHTAASTVSDAQGNFTLRDLAAGDQILDIDTTTAQAAAGGEGYAGFREMIVLASGTNTVTRPFYLPRINMASLTTIDPAATTLVVNRDLGVTLTVAPGTAVRETGDLFTGQLSISEVPRALAPAALPGDLEPGLLFTIQPVGVTFTTPAPLTLTNDRDRWPAGNRINWWSLDPERGIFTIVGEARVSDDGTMIETTSGGVRAADWHMPMPPATKSDDEPTDKPPSCDTGCGGAGDAGGGAGSGNGGGPERSGNNPAQVGSQADVHNGRLKEFISLPPYVSMSQPRNLEFVYASNRAYPMTVLTAHAELSAVAPVPATISYQGILDGVDQGYDIHLNSAVFDENADESFRVAMPLDGTPLDSNIYRGVARISSHYGATTISNQIPYNVSVVNDGTSEFGAGWRLMGLDRLYVNDAGSVMLVDGQGNPRQFLAAGQGGAAGNVKVVTQRPLTGEANTENVKLWLEEIDVEYELRAVHTGALMAAGVPQISEEDLDTTALFVWYSDLPLGRYLNQGGDPDLNFENFTSRFLQARDAGIPLYIFGRGVAPYDSVNVSIANVNVPDCCIDEPALSTWEDVTQARRFVNDADAAFNTFRSYVLPNPTHPIFQGPEGSVDATTLFGSFPQNLRPLGSGKTVLALLRTAEGDIIDGVAPIYTYTADSGARVLCNGVFTSDTAARGIVFKNSVRWLLSSAGEPGQMRSPLSDTSTMRHNDDGTYTRRLKDGRAYLFNSGGLLQTITDRNGNVMTYGYDASGRVTTVTDPVGKVTTLAYVNGTLQSVTDPASRVTMFEHDAAGNLTRVVFPDSSTRRFAYDARHLLTSQTNQREFTTTYEYNTAGQFMRSTQPDGAVRTLVPSQQIGYIDPAGVDGSGRVPAAVTRLPRRSPRTGDQQ